MSNLTIAVDDELIKLARVRAIQQGTSLSAKVREFLQSYVNESDAAVRRRREVATAQLVRTIDAAAAQAKTVVEVAAPRRRRTLRTELYEGDFRRRDRIRANSRRGA